MARPKEQFAAMELVLVTKAFITNNAQVVASEEAETFLEDPAFLENVGDIGDVLDTPTHMPPTADVMHFGIGLAGTRHEVARVFAPHRGIDDGVPASCDASEAIPSSLEPP